MSVLTHLHAPRPTALPGRDAPGARPRRAAAGRRSSCSTTTRARAPPAGRARLRPDARRDGGRRRRRCPRRRSPSTDWLLGARAAGLDLRSRSTPAPGRERARRPELPGHGGRHARDIDVRHLGRAHVICCHAGRRRDRRPRPGIDAWTRCSRSSAATCPRKILLTHIHLDHAGATGRAVRALARTPRSGSTSAARRHMLDPSKLMASARRGSTATTWTACGAGSRRCPRRTCASLVGRRAHRRLRGRVHARPRLAPRLLPARADRHGVRRRRRRRADRRRPDHRRRRRRPTSTSRRGTRSLDTRRRVGARAPRAHALRQLRRTSASTSTRCTRRSTLGCARRASRRRDAACRAPPMVERAARRGGDGARSLQAAPPDSSIRASSATGPSESGVAYPSGRCRRRSSSRGRRPGHGIGRRLARRSSATTTTTRSTTSRSTLARTIPGVTVDAGLRDRGPHPQHGPGHRLERPQGAGRAATGSSCATPA